jgi:hypothetical protein
MQHVRCDGEVSFIIAKTKRQVRVDGIESSILQLVGPDLVQQANAPSLLAQVQDNAKGFLRDPLERRRQLIAAVTTQRAQRITGQAFRMETNRDILLAHHLAVYDGDMILFVAIVPKGDDVEVAKAGWQIGDAGCPDANAVRTIPGTTMVSVLFDEVQ